MQSGITRLGEFDRVGHIEEPALLTAAACASAAKAVEPLALAVTALTAERAGTAAAEPAPQSKRVDPAAVGDWHNQVGYGVNLDDLFVFLSRFGGDQEHIVFNYIRQP